MTAAHKNKTLTTLFAFTLGGLGMHRFYLYGYRDRWAWTHFGTLPMSYLLHILNPSTPLFYSASPLTLSILAAFIEALTAGLKPDEKWDAIHNPTSNKQSNSRWPLALLLALTLGVGATILIASISRFFDLMYTGGAYG
jgi:hypothetical protein